VRQFRNRRALGGYVGLGEFSSGGSEREQGIGKDGNRRVRAAMVELAWTWLRWQSDSALSVCVPRTCRRNGRADQENHDSGPGAQAARGLVALRDGWRHSRRSKNESGVRSAFTSCPKVRSTVGGRRRNPRAHQGTDLKIGPAAKNSSPGCWDHGSGSQDPTGYEVGRECTLSGKSEFTETNKVIDFRALIRGFRTPSGIGKSPGNERGVCGAGPWGFDFLVMPGWTVVKCSALDDVRPGGLAGPHAQPSRRSGLRPGPGFSSRSAGGPVVSAAAAQGRCRTPRGRGFRLNAVGASGKVENANAALAAAEIGSPSPCASFQAGGKAGRVHGQVEPRRRGASRPGRGWAGGQRACATAAAVSPQAEPRRRRSGGRAVWRLRR
jgi:Transposase IS116/IS110/IS902 family